MTVDYTKISEQMNKSATVHKPVAQKDFRPTANATNTTGLSGKTTSNNRIWRIFALIALVLVGLYFAPFAVIVAFVIILKNKKANQQFKDFIRSTKVDLTKNPAMQNIVEKITDNIPPEHQDEVKKILADYNIKTSDDTKHD